MQAQALTLLLSILASGTLSSVLIWLSKTWLSERLKNAIQHEYNAKLETLRVQLKCQSEKELEQFKAQLKVESDRDTEGFKARLQIPAAERQIRYSHVFELTAEVLANLYANLIDLNAAVLEFNSPSINNADRPRLQQVAQQRGDELRAYYIPRQIYIPKNTQQSISKYLNLLYGFAHKSSLLRLMPSTAVNWESRCQEVTSIQDQQLPALLSLLQDDFQHLLGLEGPEPSATAKP